MASPANDAVRIVLLEDNAELRDQILSFGLSKYGFAVTAVATATALYECIKTHAPHMVVLDVGPPGDDRFGVAQAVRSLLPHIGVILLSGVVDLAHQCRGLRMGADAYLVKPVPLELLAATMRSLARRLSLRPVIGTARWRFDAGQGCLISPRGLAAGLSKTEQRVVSRLAATLGQLVTREQLVAAVSADTITYDPHRIDSLIHRLRRKVATHCGEGLPLKAVHGKGYVLNAGCQDVD